MEGPRLLHLIDTNRQLAPPRCTPRDFRDSRRFEVLGTDRWTAWTSSVALLFGAYVVVLFGLLTLELRHGREHAGAQHRL